MFTMSSHQFLFIFILVKISSSELSVPVIRGISPADVHYIQSKNGTFTCLDGSLTIPFSQVNDDYCDCKDSSDEPGTSACPNGTFYCVNEGFKPKTLVSGRVNDGICDCCDGSDENTIKCPNLCKELKERHQEKAQKMNEIVQSAAEKRNLLIKKGKLLTAQKVLALKDFEEILASQKEKLKEKEQLKRKYEAKEAEALDRYKKEHPDDKEPQYDKETQEIIKNATKARRDCEDLKFTLETTEKQVKYQVDYLARDFGAEGEYAALEGECFEFKEKEHVYKLCLFVDITQHQENQLHTMIKLGYWNDWSGPENNPYEMMLYDNGQPCWNGPKRTATVKLVCDLENHIKSVKEPNKCEYLIEFGTPAACIPSVVHDEL